MGPFAHLPRNAQRFTIKDQQSANTITGRKIIIYPTRFPPNLFRTIPKRFNVQPFLPAQNGSSQTHRYNAIHSTHKKAPTGREPVLTGPVKLCGRRHRKTFHRFYSPLCSLIFSQWQLKKESFFVFLILFLPRPLPRNACLKGKRWIPRIFLTII